ncbi:MULTISPECIES: YlaF family protein [Aneurinibacillus]|jgi:Flp pilus assembly protein TadB|uniref:Uncharacterized protein n=1 Tax=Aneurinibacillus danicus TaxID=267746 RepID=A0A511VAK8_9BACL|nr:MULTISPECIES: YlaF family protein [Aneurinibacillus]GEN35966.1 hypothetical protein ADA01nite_34260 [Aneurinibacillus danicus]
MTKHQKQSLLLAILGVVCFVGVGISVGERSGLMAGIFLIGAILIIGFGFMLKAKRRKNGQL